MPEMSAPHSLEAETRLPEPALALPQAVQNHEPEEPRPAGRHDDHDLDPELNRLEGLLYTRSQQGRALASELARCDRLLREALERIPSLASSELQALRHGYDAAVERAIEAEVGRAELTFALDETRAQLTAAGTSATSGSLAHPRAAAPGVYARVAELEEAEGNLHARLMLAEQDREAAQQRVKTLVREVQELNERAELLMSRERALQDALHKRDAHEHVLRAEQRGVAARADETERAFQALYARLQQLEQRSGGAQERLAEAQADVAEQSLLVQAHATRIEELQRGLSLEQQEVRNLRAQVAASVSAQQQQSAAREADEAKWAERVRELSERLVGADEKLRALLRNLKQPLRELDASLDQRGPDARVLQVAEALHSEEAGGGFDVASARSEATRLTEELARERTRRRRLGATVRALQAASETGEATAPWIQELLTILSEGASLPPNK